MESADRVLRILEVFAASDRELTLSDIAERMNLPKSSVHRLLATLATRGFVERDGETRRYALGLRLFEIGSAAIHGRGLHTAVYPALEKLMIATGETCHFAIRSGAEAVYVYKLDGPSAIPMPSRVGGRAPLHATGIGKVLLAWGSADLRRQVFSRPLKPYARNTITEPARLAAELDLVAERGYALDRDEFEEGLRCVAAPVRDMTQRVVAAVGIAAPAFRLTDSALPAAIEAVTRTSDECSRRLGHVQTARARVLEGV